MIDRLRLFALLGSLMIFLVTAANAKQFAVVVNKSNTTASVTPVELTKVFKCGTQRWQDGRDVILVLRDSSVPAMQVAMRKLYKMKIAEFKDFVQTHKSCIVVVGTDQQLIDSVQHLPGAVGLVDVYSISDRVKVLKIDDRLPFQENYFLRDEQ